MNLNRFQKMTFKERARWVHFNGQFIASIRYYGFKINLYLIERLYVEVFYNHAKDCVEKIETLDNQSTRMKFYADQVRLTDLNF